MVESCGARDDSPSWNLGRAKQGDTIQVDGTSPRGRGQVDVKESEQGGCFRVQHGQVQGQAAERDAQLADPAARESTARRKPKENDASVTRRPGNDDNSKNNSFSREE